MDEKHSLGQQPLPAEPVKGQQRLASQLADLFVGHLFMLTLLIIYFIVYNLINMFTGFQLAPLIIYLCVILAVWLPWTLFASAIENKFQASLGQLMLRQTTQYSYPTWWRYWLRQILKSLPYLLILLAFLSVWLSGANSWQIVLIVIAGFYIVSIWLMIIRREDGRHWIDLLLSSQVVENRKE